MGIVSRFERRLQSAVGDAFARVFGGSVLPQEVETALEREAADQVRDLNGGHRLAPNSYIISINPSDHERLAADHDLAVRTFSRHLDGYIRDQGWQTYGDVHVEFEPSPNLHTGQFRTRGRVDPDVASHAPNGPVRGPDRRSYPPQRGAGPMSQSPGQGPGSSAGEPDDARDDEYRPPASGNGAHPANGGGPYRERAYQDFDNPGGYPPQHDAPDGGYQRYYSNEPQQDQHAPAGYADQDYHDRGYPAYQDPRYDGSYSPPAPPDAYGGDAYAEQPGYAYIGNNPDYGRPDYGYNQGYQAGYTATLQLDDGSGRVYRLRAGSNVIGRGQDAHFRLPDTGVSRRHFEIRWDGHVAMLGDLGSTNGTSVNGATVHDWQLADGDVIRAGHSDIVVRII